MCTCPDSTNGHPWPGGGVNATDPESRSPWVSGGLRSLPAAMPQPCRRHAHDGQNHHHYRSDRIYFWEANKGARSMAQQCKHTGRLSIHFKRPSCRPCNTDSARQVGPLAVFDLIEAITLELGSGGTCPAHHAF
jgi:hypothetical protein